MGCYEVEKCVHVIAGKCSGGELYDRTVHGRRRGQDGTIREAHGTQRCSCLFNARVHYGERTVGVSKDEGKENELWSRAAELGSAMANHNLGVAYSEGRVVDRDGEKVVEHFALAAIGGDHVARHNL